MLYQPRLRPGRARRRLWAADTVPYPRSSSEDKMQAPEVDALLAELSTIASDTVSLLAEHRVVQAWLEGTLDRDSSFALQAQIYHQVAQTVPLLQRTAATC